METTKKPIHLILNDIINEQNRLNQINKALIAEIQEIYEKDKVHRQAIADLMVKYNTLETNQKIHRNYEQGCLKNIKEQINNLKKQLEKLNNNSSLYVTKLEQKNKWYNKLFKSIKIKLK